jgi:hypothetical protein
MMKLQELVTCQQKMQTDELETQNISLLEQETGKSMTAWVGSQLLQRELEGDTLNALCSKIFKEKQEVEESIAQLKPAIH